MEATVNGYGYSSLVELETKGHAIFETVFGALNKFHELAVCKKNRFQDIHLVFTKETENNYEAIWLTSHLELLDVDEANTSSAPTDSSSILLLDSHSADESMWKLYQNMAKLLDDSDEKFPQDEQLFYAISVASNYSFGTEN